MNQLHWVKCRIVQQAVSTVACFCCGGMRMVHAEEIGVA